MYINDPSRQTTPHAIWGERFTKPANLTQGKFPPKPTKAICNHSLYHLQRYLLWWPISNVSGKAINNNAKKQCKEIFVHCTGEEIKRNLSWSSSDSSLKIWAMTFRSVNCQHRVAVYKLLSVVVFPKGKGQAKLAAQGHSCPSQAYQKACQWLQLTVSFLEGLTSVWQTSQMESSF